MATESLTLKRQVVITWHTSGAASGKAARKTETSIKYTERETAISINQSFVHALFSLEVNFLNVLRL